MRNAMNLETTQRVSAVDVNHTCGTASRNFSKTRLWEDVVTNQVYVKGDR
jgi:hypothetical protein